MENNKNTNEKGPYKHFDPLNILLISVTFEVSKLDKSRDVNLLQLSNIPFISVTFEVFNCEKSNETFTL